MASPREHWGGRGGLSSLQRAQETLEALRVRDVADASARDHAEQGAGRVAEFLAGTAAADLEAVYAAQDARCGLPLPAAAAQGASCVAGGIGSAAAHAAAVAGLRGRAADFAVFLDFRHAAVVGGGWPQLRDSRSLSVAWSLVLLACFRADISTGALLRGWTAYDAAVRALAQVSSPRGQRWVLPPLHSRDGFLRFLLAVAPHRVAGWPAAVDEAAGRAAAAADGAVFYADDHPKGIPEAALLAAVAANPRCIAGARAQSCFSQAVLAAAVRGDHSMAAAMADSLLRAKGAMPAAQHRAHARALRAAVRQCCLDEPDAAVGQFLFDAVWAKGIEDDPGGSAASQFADGAAVSPAAKARALQLLRSKIEDRGAPQDVVAGYNALLVRVASPPTPFERPATPRGRASAKKRRSNARGADL